MLTKLYVNARTWAESEEGATALEYGILVALIALIIIAGVGLFGTNLNRFFNNIAGRVPLGTP
jgi:pilus assembly protein Flp/PilA